VGPWSDEGPTIAAMHRFAEEQGYTLTGKHHEIYMGDPRRTAPEKLKTVIRQPVRKALARSRQFVGVSAAYTQGVITEDAP
jgi:hypothetical protein